jgi:surfactin synthase thioesterase subunit
MPPLIDTQSDRMVARAAGDAELKLLMFHHAGGSAAAMLQLTRQLPGTVEATAFELAGRGVRMSEPAASTFAEARDELLHKVRESLDRPTVIFGHT